MIELDEMNEENVEKAELYNPVTVTISESIGTMALAVIALILLSALLKAQGRIRELQEQLYTGASE